MNRIHLLQKCLIFKFLFPFVKIEIMKLDSIEFFVTMFFIGSCVNLDASFYNAKVLIILRHYYKMYCVLLHLKKSLHIL